MTIKVKNLIIGEGRPKICSPITAPDVESIAREAEGFRGRPIDLIEWRMDCFKDIRDIEKAEAVLKVISQTLPELPLLCTFRTKAEGGNTNFSPEEYRNLNRRILETGAAGLLDIELSTGEDTVAELIGETHKKGVKVILSSHDFEKTPDQSEIVGRLCRMQELGADMAKIAVMPVNRKDVITLLAATREMYEEHAQIPIITMSMGKLGVCSRILGETFGSAVTFASAGTASAPGQMKVEDAASVLQILH